MIKIIFLFLTISSSLIYCIDFKYDDLCYPKQNNNNKEFTCHGKYNFSCGDFLCIKNQYNCQILSLFSSLKGEHKNKYQLFMSKVKDCPQPPKYKWNLKYICLKSKNCTKFKVTIWSIQRISSECNCSGKYSYNCNSNYCALNKKACDEKPKKKLSSIKKCDQ